MELITLPKKTVEEWLNETCYALDPHYQPSTFAIEFIAFIKLVNGSEGEENESPVVHLKMLDNVSMGHRDIANLCHRGLGKTAVLAEYFFLYISVYGGIPGIIDIDLGIYVSDSIENGVKNMRKNLEFRWENSDFLRHYVPHTKFTDVRWEFTNIDGKHLVLKGYGAKALSLDSRLYTADGYTTIGECEVGDMIYGPDGQLAPITAKSEVFHKPMYELILEDGRKLKVSEDHINSVMVNTQPNGTALWEDMDLTTKELLHVGWEHTKKGNKHPSGVSTKCTMKVRNTLPLVYPEKELEVDPYTLGLVLGDGSIKRNASGIVLTGDKSDMDYYRNHIPYELGEDYVDKRRPNVITYAVKGINQNIRNLGLAVHGNNKFIPEDYFFGSIGQRTALLQGLLDTDGSIFGSGRITFVSASERLTEDVARLVRSLGGKAKYQNKGGNAYHIEIWMGLNPFKLPRKAAKYVFDRRHWNNCNVVDIKRIDDEPSQCIAIDSASHQYLSGEYFRTHNTGVRGAKEMGKRPQLAILDDLISDEDAKSPTTIAKIKDVVYSAIEHALHPTDHLCIWSGTPFNANDPLYEAVESGAWAVNVYPVCEKFPCTREEFRGSWEDRFTYDYVLAKYNKALLVGKIDSFNQELMLRIMSDEDRLVKDHEIQWYSRNSIMPNIDGYNIYISTDFATGEKQANDYSVISVWALNHNGDWFWLDGVCRKQLMDATMKDLFRLVQKYEPISVGIEVSGQQAGFVSWIRQQMLDTNIFFNLASDNNNGEPGIRPVKDKLSRFELVVPWFNSHKMYFPDELRDSEPMIEMHDELTKVSRKGFKSKHDDFSDTVSMLYAMHTFRPSMTSELSRNDRDVYVDLDEDDYEGTLDSYLGG